MEARRLYNEFLKKEKDGNYDSAWTSLIMAMYGKRFKTYKELIDQMYKRSWYQERKHYLDVNDFDWQMTVATIFDDAENREDGIICYLAYQILDSNYRWYGACAHLYTMERLMQKYPEWDDFKEAMAEKAKRLGFDVNK